MKRQFALLLAAFAFGCTTDAKTSDQSGPSEPQLGSGGATTRPRQAEGGASSAASSSTSGAGGITARQPATASTGGIGATTNDVIHRPSGGSPASSRRGSTANGGVGAKTNSSMQNPGTTGGRSATNTRASASGASATMESSGGTRSTSAAATGDAVRELEAYLAEPRATRPELEAQPFSEVPLTREQAALAADLLWKDYARFIADTRRAEHNSKTIKLGELSLRYAFTTFGQKPATGRSLYISLHGGGNADASVNDQQWENQKTLYQPDEGIYLAPRAPTNTWNLWHEKHIDPMFERLITNLIVLEEVNPDRVYVMGYSAGGDGVYQLGPRMADYWAAAAVMAGHPNDANSLSLRNIAFTIHVGALDTAYDRNLVAPEWGRRLDQLQAEDPAGYVHVVQVHQGKAHWMDLEDAVAVPWMAQFTRNPSPKTIVWYQDDVPHTRFYWLAVEPEQATAKTQVKAACVGQQITLETRGLTKLKIRLSDSLLDLDQPISVTANGQVQPISSVKRNIATLSKTLQERGDPRSIYGAEIEVQLPQG